MTHYLAFGRKLTSDFSFPELPVAAADGPPAWTFELNRGPAPGEAERRLGSDKVYGAVQVHSWVRGSGLRLVYEDTGTFDVSADGSQLTWYPPLGPQPDEAARADVIGRVLPMAMHLQGIFTLHASAVSTAGQTGIALMAPKGYGKSTLAAALMAAGSRLISDDAVPVAGLSDHVARLLPGIFQVRLWGDSAAQVGLGSPSAAGRKVVVTEFANDRLLTEPVPFAAAYVLAPVTANASGAVVERIRLTEIEGAMALVEHSKIGALLGGTEGPAFFDQAVSVARRVPVYALRVARDLARLDEAARTMMAWHA